MNKLMPLIALSLVFSFCKTSAKPPCVSPIQVPQDTVISPQFYLKNRIPDCEKAIAYMDSMIVPLNLSIIRGHMNTHAEGVFQIIGNPDNLFETKKCYYYLNTECFVGKRSESIFKLFCPSDKYEELIKVDRFHTNNKNLWIMGLRGSGGLGIYFEFVDGIVVKSSMSNGRIRME